MTSNGHDDHKFLTLDQKYQHEPSCPDNPGRVPEDRNPER